MMARARSKDGGLVRQAAQSAPSPGSTPNGKPQQSHKGPSRKEILLQHEAQKPWPWPKGSRQAMQSGGNRRSAIFQFSVIASNLASVVASKFACRPYRDLSELRNQNDTRSQ